MGDLRILQRQVSLWHADNYFETGPVMSALAVAEEVGELARAVLKQAVEIRGTHEQWQGEIRKELGDVFITLCGLARACDIDLDDAIWARWNEVQDTHRRGERPSAFE